jgi:hypothetical protein
MTRLTTWRETDKDDSFILLFIGSWLVPKGRTPARNHLGQPGILRGAAERN